MTATVTVDRVTPADNGFDDAVALFEQYRVHYGETADPERARDWLRAGLTAGQLLAFLARAADASPVGVSLVAPVPASLSLREFWTVRDMYVVPAARRRGVGRSLLEAVVVAARERGAIRLSLQTEVENDGALALYHKFGFRPVTGLRHLTLGLPKRP